VRLYTEVYLPKGADDGLPSVLIRTPYPDSTFPFSMRPIELFTSGGYAVAVQSCRGTWQSEGEFRFFQNEAADGYDCVEWMAKQSWSNGRIGMYGSSYSGSTQWLAARLRPPHLTCIAPQSPAGMFFYETPYIGGAYFKHHFLAWPQLIAKHSWEQMTFNASEDMLTAKPDPTSALYRAMQGSSNLAVLREWYSDHPQLAGALSEALEHPTLDEWWRSIMLTAEAAREIKIPVLCITGFHDGDQAGALYNWEVIEANEESSAGKRHLLVGPWRHAQMLTGKAAPMGLVTFPGNADVSLPKMALRFYDAYMKEDPHALSRLPVRCRLYMTGSNQWYESKSYPPAETEEIRMYLSSAGHANSLFGDGRLTFDSPSDEPADKMAVDWRVPVQPVGIGEDARESEARHDVLVFTSDALETNLSVLGPVSAELYISVDACDCDVVVRIADVWPEGNSVNMTGEFGFGSFRARYRHGFHQEVMATPQKPMRLRFHICHSGHVFQKGHRVRVSIMGTVSNVLEPNHHTGEPVLTAVTRHAAVETLFHDHTRPSSMCFRILKGNVA